MGGAIMAYELKDQLRPEDKVTVVTKDPTYHFVPSNPWIAVGWRGREDITVDLAPTMQKNEKTPRRKRLGMRRNRCQRVIFGGVVVCFIL